ncbi:MAG: hypothetical protein Q7R49_01185 [Candidatus Daviesbacteria bacterium]|nr:hypothetical protein [Candidatus Daviesbacteria bacterium]
MTRVEDFSGRDFTHRLPYLGAVKDFIVNTVTAQPLPWGDRKGPPNYRGTAVGLYDYPEEPKKWPNLSEKVLYWAKGTERFMGNILKNKIVF